MAIATGQTISKQSNVEAGSTASASFGTAPAAGSLVLIGLVGWHDSGYDVTSVTDNKGNAYTIVKAAVAGRQRAVIAYAENVSSGGTFTVTINNAGGSGNYLSWAAIEVTGVAASSSADQTSTATDAGPQANDATVTTGATVTANELVFAVMSLSSSGSSNLHITSPGGYTNLASEQDFAAQNGFSADYKIISATGAQTAAWAHDDATGTDNPSPGGSSYGWTAAIATFKEAGGASSSLFPPFPPREPTTHLRM
jgi:hypothetical protein